MPVLIFQPTVNSRTSDSESKCVRTVLVSWEKDAVMRSVDVYIGVCEVLGGGGGTFCPLNESLIFKNPDA